MVYEKFLGPGKLEFKAYLEEAGVLELIKRKNLKKITSTESKLGPLCAK